MPEGRVDSARVSFLVSKLIKTERESRVSSRGASTSIAQELVRVAESLTNDNSVTDFIRDLERMGFHEQDGEYVKTNRSVASDDDSSEDERDDNFYEKYQDKFSDWAKPLIQKVNQLGQRHKVKFEIGTSSVYGDVSVKLSGKATPPDAAAALKREMEYKELGQKEEIFQKFGEDLEQLGFTFEGTTIRQEFRYEKEPERNIQDGSDEDAENWARPWIQKVKQLARRHHIPIEVYITPLSKSISVKAEDGFWPLVRW
jgi:hypothetical protein